MGAAEWDDKYSAVVDVEPEWWNWQTRCVQGAVPVRVWGFKSPLRQFFPRFIVDNIIGLAPAPAGFICGPQTS